MTAATLRAADVERARVASLEAITAAVRTAERALRMAAEVKPHAASAGVACPNPVQLGAELRQAFLDAGVMVAAEISSG